MQGRGKSANYQENLISHSPLSILSHDYPIPAHAKFEPAHGKPEPAHAKLELSHAKLKLSHGKLELSHNYLNVNTIVMALQHDDQRSAAGSS